MSLGLAASVTPIIAENVDMFAEMGIFFLCHPILNIPQHSNGNVRMTSTENNYSLRLPTPLQEIVSEVFAQQCVRLFVKREDLSHPFIGGNKWRKLKYNLLEAKRLSLSNLLTFGGAYSNHLAAVAAAGQAFGFQTLGVVRGERTLPLNPTLMYAEMCGMELRFVSRANFRNRNHNSMLLDINIDADGYYVLPEGGSNCLALRGVAELAPEIAAQLHSLPDFLVTACGTGATLAGLAVGMANAPHDHTENIVYPFTGQGSTQKTILGIPVLKGGFMEQEVHKLLSICDQNALKNSRWEIKDGYHFGGYAKWTPGLVQFINSFKQAHGVPLDPVYTGKAMFAVFDLAEKGYFPKNSTVVFLHTGGLQGIAGYNQRFGGVVETHSH